MPAVIAKLLEVAPVSAPDAAVSVYVPGTLRRRSLNVATPATAFTVAVPVSSAPAGAPAAMPTVTAPVNADATAPLASTAFTTTAGVSAAPAAVVAGGCTANTRRTGSIDRAVAVNATGEPDSPVAVAVRDCAPAVGPRRHVVWALPDASVVTVAEPTEPPLAAAKVTGTPGAPWPSVAVTRTTTGWGSVVLTGPVWPLPDTAAIALGGA